MDETTKCLKCNGTGIIYSERWKISDRTSTKVCSFCKGKGFIDWIENIFGVDNNEMPKM